MKTKTTVTVCECGKPTRRVGEDQLEYCEDHGIVEGNTKEVSEAQL